MIAWMPFLERVAGVKGGFAAAKRSKPLTPAARSSSKIQAIKAVTRPWSKSVRDVPGHLSGMSPGYTSSPRMTTQSDRDAP